MQSCGPPGTEFETNVLGRGLWKMEFGVQLYYKYT